MEPRYRAGLRAVLVVGAWLAAAVDSAYVAASTAIGPTILTVSSDLGAQTGDLAFALAAAGVAALLTRRLAPLTGADVRGMLAVGTWLGATVLTLLMAARTSVGPVLLGLSTTHGVHAGDVAFGLVAVAGAALVTHLLLTPLRERRPPLPSRDPGR